MKSIGGYFELESINKNPFYFPDLKLNSGQSCLEYILKYRSIKSIKIPYYTCNAVITLCIREVKHVSFYNLNDKLEIVNTLKDDGSFILVNNYFGLKDSYINKITKKFKNVIVDNAQAFFSKPLENIDTFYSPRKFFGVPDGGYLFTNIKQTSNLKESISYDNFNHLLKRIEYNSDIGYKDYLENENRIKEESIMLMSNLTKYLLNGIDYETIISKRKLNFNYLHNLLGPINQIKISLDSFSGIPFIYPFQTNSKDLRSYLVENKVFVARYWQNIEEWLIPNSLESRLVNQIIPLPIDQRYDSIQMDYIAKLILKFLKND